MNFWLDSRGEHGDECLEGVARNGLSSVGASEPFVTSIGGPQTRGPSRYTQSQRIMADKLKIGVIGAGFIGQMAHLEGYSKLADKCEIAAVCDLRDEKLDDVRKKFDIAKTTKAWMDLVNDKEIDAISVATPNIEHREMTIAALKAGKHVLCEKPMAMNGKEAREMCAVERESGKILQIGLQNRFSSAGYFMTDFIESGQMGDIQFARAQALRRRGVPHWGVFINKEKQGGGPLIDIGVHILDLTLAFMGYPKPTVATGKTWDSLGKDPEVVNFYGDYDRSKFTVEDFACAMIRFENGACVSLESSFMANLEDDPIRTQLFGTKAGAIVQPWDDKNPVKIFKETNKQYFEMVPHNMPSIPSPHHEEVRRFIDAIENGKPSPVPGRHGMILNAIFDAVYASSVSGREVEVDTDF